MSIATVRVFGISALDSGSLNQGGDVCKSLDYVTLTFLAWPLSNAKTAEARRVTPFAGRCFYNLTCSEEFPRISDAMIRSGGQGTVVGFSSVLQHQAVCRHWPVAPIDSALWQEVRSTVPALIMGGALDHITPPRYARSVAAAMPNSRLLVVPSRGHNDFDPCIAQLIRQFVLHPDAARVDTSCLLQTRSLRFPTSKAELSNR